MHVQDVDMNAPAPAPACRRRAACGARRSPVGKGSIDWVKTFTGGEVGGVKNYFVEQNMELTKESVAALKAMNV